MLLDIETISGFIKDPDSAPTEGTYDYCVKAINNRISEITPVAYELLTKGIDFKKEFPELFLEYKKLLELQKLTNKA